MPERPHPHRCVPEQLHREIAEKRVVLASPPETINIEFTDRCHVQPPCAYCVGKNLPGYREMGHISADQLDRYLPYLLRSARVNDGTYGEFLLFSRHQELIERLSAAGVRFGFTTIGHLLDERKARFLIEHADWVDFAVSVNAATAPTYHRYQGKGFERVMSNLERFAQLHQALRPGKPSPMSLSYIVMRHNRDEVFDFLRLAQGLQARCVILRHLFDMRRPEYVSTSFGTPFVYEQERLPQSEYMALRSAIEESDEFAALRIDYEWNAPESFIAEQRLPGVDIPCLFPWKFLCIRPLHDLYTPCVFLKRGIAKPSAATPEEVWNGETMVEMRRSLASGQIPHFCRTYGDACPIVLNAGLRRPPQPPAAGSGFVAARWREVSAEPAPLPIVLVPSLAPEDYVLEGAPYRVAWLQQQTALLVNHSGPRRAATLELQLATFRRRRRVTLLLDGRPIGAPATIRNLLWEDGAEDVQFDVVLEEGDNRFVLATREPPDRLADGRSGSLLLVQPGHPPWRRRSAAAKAVSRLRRRVLRFLSWVTSAVRPRRKG